MLVKRLLNGQEINLGKRSTILVREVIGYCGFFKKQNITVYNF